MKLLRIRLGSIDDCIKHQHQETRVARFRQSLWDPRVIIIATQRDSGKFRAQSFPHNARDFLRLIDHYLQQEDLYLYNAKLTKDGIGTKLAWEPYYRIKGNLYTKSEVSVNTPPSS